MTIPKEIKEIYKKPEFVCDYNEYKVYCENYEGACIGMPEFLLYKDNTVKRASKKEIHEIMDLLPDD